MSLGKFNAHRDIRIDRVKAHHSYLRPKKEKPMSRDTTDYEADYDKQCAAPWEITNVKGLCAALITEGDLCKIKYIFFRSLELSSILLIFLKYSLHLSGQYSSFIEQLLLHFNLFTINLKSDIK